MWNLLLNFTHKLAYFPGECAVGHEIGKNNSLPKKDKSKNEKELKSKWNIG